VAIKSDTAVEDEKPTGALFDGTLGCRRKIRAARERSATKTGYKTRPPHNPAAVYSRTVRGNLDGDFVRVNGGALVRTL